MHVQCQICGQAVEVSVWSEDYEKLKQSSEHPYICEGCADKIRADAMKDHNP